MILAISGFLACPLILHTVPSSCCLSSLLHAVAGCCLAAAAARGREWGHWVNMGLGHAKLLRLQQLDCHWGKGLLESRPWLLLLRVAPLWVLVILVIAHWMCCSITYEIRISRRFSRDWQSIGALAEINRKQITCNICHRQYAGQASGKLKVRLNDHRSNIKLNKNTTISIHFNSPLHIISNFKITPIEQIDSNYLLELFRREQCWMNTLQTKYSNGLPFTI